MILHFETVVATGSSSLDSGIGDTALKTFNGTTYLYSTTGPLGGAVVWRLVEGALPQFHDSEYFSSNITLQVGRFGQPVSLAGNDHLVLDINNATGLVSYGLNPDGTFGGLQETGTLVGGGDIAALAELDIGLGQVVAIAHEKTGQISTYSVNSDGTLNMLGSISGDSDAIEVLHSGSSHYLVTTDAASNSVATYSVDDATGRISAIDNSDSFTTLGIATPTAVEVVQAYGQSWVIVAGAQSNSLSVMQLQGDGMLKPTDHVLDSRHTRFDSVQDIAVTEVGGQVFVVAGGGDDGVSLFTMTPNGQLVHQDSFADTNQSGLQNVQTLSLAEIGDELQIFAASQQDAGLTQLSVDVSDIGVVWEGWGTVEGTAGADILTGGIFDTTLRGGAGDDILIAGVGATTMAGGSGADIFVMQYGSDVTTIQDFQPGVDRLDMFDFILLRSPHQLNFTQNAQGARIEYRDEVIELHSASGNPLTLEQTFGAGFEGPDHIPVDFGRFGGLDPGSSEGIAGPVSINSQTANSAIADAEVRFTLNGGGTVAVRTDAEGRFDLELPSGAYEGELDIIKTYSTASQEITALDALQVLRISVGLNPTWGPPSAENLIAADVNQDGSINAIDALAILQTSVGQTAARPPQWVFLDEDADLSGITRTNVAYETGVEITITDGMFETDMTSILLGNLEQV